MKRSVALVAVTLSLFVLAGCGGGSDSSPASGLAPGGLSRLDPAASAARVTAGQAALGELFRSEQVPTLSQMSGMRNTFAEAYRLDNTNQQAAFGLAVTTVAARTQQAVYTLAISGRSRAETERLVAQTMAGFLPWQTKSVRADFGANTVKAVVSAPFAVQKQMHGRQVNSAKLKSELQGILESLNTAIPLMELSAAASDFGFALNYEPTEAMVIDQADAKTLLAGMYAARAALSVALAYEVNPSSFDLSQTVSATLPPLANGARVSPDQYFPPAPFGNLASDGKSRFTQAKADLALAADMARSATTTFATRPVATGHLINSNGLDLGTLTAGADAFKAALTNPYPLPDGTVVNLGAWFAHPPTSLRALLPTYTYVVENAEMGTGEAYFVANPSDYPDPTFGGLVISQPAGNPQARVPYNTPLIDLITGGL
jgi:hypothetical protein